MKEIKTENFNKINKNSQNWMASNNLPPGVTDRMIDDRMGSPDDDIVNNREGETEVEVNWPEFKNDYEQEGEPLPLDIAERTVPSFIDMKYTYSYDYNENKADDIVVIQIADYLTKGYLTDAYLIEFFKDYYDREIREDIEIGEESEKIGRGADPNPFE